jgi:hypothetical protein
MRRVLIIVCCGLGLLPATASAAGGPPSPLQGGAGVSTPGGEVAYVALWARDRTVVAQIRRQGGAVERSRVFRGAYGVPGVAYDGSATGLSGDGRVLVLAESPRVFPVRRSRLLVLGARSLRTRDRVTLPGYFTVDAISPDGRWLYLIHYTSTRDLNRYEVRAYDLRAGRLVREPVIDVREPDEAMAGLPMARVMSADGRWAYTLYDRPGKEPFIHALDTARREAFCIDLPGVKVASLQGPGLALGGDGRTLQVRGDGRPVRLVDTETFAVRRPEPAAKRAASVPAPAEGGGASGWALGAAGLLVAALAAVGLVVRRRRPRRGLRASTARP